MDNKFSAANVVAESLGDFGEFRFVGEKFRSQPVHGQGVRMGISFRIDIPVKVVFGDSAIQDFHTADFNDPVTIVDIQAGCFGIEYDLSHIVLFLFAVSSSLFKRRAMKAPSYRAFSGMRTR